MVCSSFKMKSNSCNRQIRSRLSRIMGVFGWRLYSVERCQGKIEFPPLLLFSAAPEEVHITGARELILRLPFLVASHGHRPRPTATATAPPARRPSTPMCSATTEPTLEICPTTPFRDPMLLLARSLTLPSRIHILPTNPSGDPLHSLSLSLSDTLVFRSSERNSERRRRTPSRSTTISFFFISFFSSGG